MVKSVNVQPSKKKIYVPLLCYCDKNINAKGSLGTGKKCTLKADVGVRQVGVVCKKTWE